MEALIPKLFILAAEASVVFFLLLVAVLIFNSKAKRKDIKAVNELIGNYTGSKEERISSLKNHLKSIGFKGNTDEHAEQLYNQEKSVIKEFVTLYLRRDTYRLLDYPDNIIESDNSFLKTSGAGLAATVTAAPENSESEDSNSEQTANATILAREQAESNEAHLKELAELRLKNTELNEHLFEALETITALMTEHGKKTGQEVESNAQKILDAIIYLRDKRLNTNNDPSNLAPPLDENDEVDSFDLDDNFDSIETDNAFSVDLADNDATLDDATAVNLGINDELNVDLDTLEDDNEPETKQNTNNTSDTPKTEVSEEAIAINLEDTTQSTSEEVDPWADALTEQANAEAETTSEEEDPWADALAEQASAEADKTEADAAPEEADPWADALAEQASAEAEQSEESEEEIDPWAEALAEQERSEKK